MTAPHSKAPEPRTGMPSPKLGRDAFERRYRAQFVDPGFAALQPELDRIVAVTWDAYANSRKSPHTRKAGAGFEDPDYDLSVDWIEAHAGIAAPQTRHDDPALPHRILLINGSSRSEHSCPGEMSKSWRLVELAREVLDGQGVETEVLDLSRLSSEYGRAIHPARPASRPPPRSATGPAPATPTTRSARRRTG